MRPPTHQGPPVLVLGKHLTGIGVLRSLASLGIETYAAEDTNDVITRSRLYHPPTARLPETADSAVLATYLERLSIDRAVVIACSDRWTLALSGLPTTLRQRFLTSVPPRDAVETLLDKDRLRELARRLGIPHPRSTLLRSAADLEALSDADLAGGFLKPTDSQLHNRTFGTKGFFVESRAEVLARLEAAAGIGITYLLQEWIPGGIGNTVLLDGFVDRVATVRGLTARRRIRMNPARLGNTTAAVTIPLAEVRLEVEQVRTLLGALDYRGIFNAELKLDDRDGDYRLIEVNPRPAWFTSTLRSAGADLVRMAYLDAQGLEVPSQRVYRVGRYGVCETPDAIAIARGLSEGRTPDGPVLRPWLLGDRVLFRWADPVPFLTDLWRSVAGRLGAFGLAPGRYLMASGLTGEPTPPVIGRGAADRRNS